MRRELKQNAYAKINLYLEVKGRREDGYHEIDTVMQTVGLCDLLTVGYDPDGSGITLTCQKKYIPTDSGNIAYKCAELFLSRTGKGGAVDIHIEKRIPVAAGLGGGSTDGAAVLRALNVLTGARLTVEALCALGAEVGADIPFCLRGGCARARGIGELFSDAPSLVGFVPVIAIGGHGSSTPAAYKALDAEGYCGEGDAEKMLCALEKKDGSVVCELYNAFESVILRTNKDARTLKNRFAELGARGALMSGSGASVFGLFGNRNEARVACAKLRELGYFAVVAQIPEA